MQAKFNHNGFDFTFSDEDVCVLADFIPKGEYNPHNVRPWFIHDHGFPLAIVFASCEQDALNVAADEGKLDQFQVTEKDLADYGDEGEGITHLGNASEPFDIENVGMFELPHVPFSFAAMFAAADLLPRRNRER